MSSQLERMQTGFKETLRFSSAHLLTLCVLWPNSQMRKRMLYTCKQVAPVNQESLFLMVVDDGLTRTAYRCCQESYHTHSNVA